MACFVAPAAVAVVTTVVRKVVEKKEAGSATNAQTSAEVVQGKWTKRLGWLNTMLWGGVLMLVLDHLISGELVPWWPFLSAISTGEVSGMLREIAITGGAMTAAVFVAWGAIVLVIEARAKAKARLARESQ